MRRCADGSPCLSPDTPGCAGPFLGHCGRPARAAVVRSVSARRGAIGPPAVAYAGSPAPRPLAGLPPGGVAQAWPAAWCGGAERAMITILKATSPAVPWRGVALLSDEAPHDPAILDELRRLGPVAIGRDASAALLAGAGAVVSWAIPDLRDLAPGVPHVAVSHSPAGSPWAVATLGRAVGVDRWVAVSDAARGPIPEAERSGAVVIPNAVDPGRLRVTRDRAAMLAEWGLPPGAKVLGGLNRLSAEKRTERLVDAVAALPPGWFGVVVGEGFDRAGLERHAAERAPGRVIFPGNRSDVGNVLNAFDRLLVASEYESFCLTLAEAFRLGVPVVACPVGIAADHPDAVRLLPADPTGAEIAAAALAPPAGPAIGRELARRLWSPEALGRSWADLLRPMLAPADLAPERLARACAHASCRARCGHLLCARDHREVHFATDCVSCATGA